MLGRCQVCSRRLVLSESGRAPYHQVAGVSCLGGGRRDPSVAMQERLQRELDAVDEDTDLGQVTLCLIQGALEGRYVLYCNDPDDDSEPIKYGLPDDARDA